MADDNNSDIEKKKKKKKRHRNNNSNGFVVVIVAASVVVVLAAVVLRLVGGEKKDTTAQGVAKIRHCETILEDPEERLYEDPYARFMYPGSSIVDMMGGGATRALFDALLPDGIFDLLSLRTKWIDDVVTSHAGGGGFDKLVILGAGYDTRGFRLDLPDNANENENENENDDDDDDDDDRGFVVWEVDQPDVQSRKRRLMEGIAESDPKVAARLGESSSSSSSRSSSPRVEFVAVDFNVDSVGERLASRPGFGFDRRRRRRRRRRAIVTLEGVTMYIPSSATADTLRQTREVVAEGSVLAVSYAPSEVVADPERACGRAAASAGRKLRWLLKGIELFGEPWIGAVETAAFASLLRESGWEVLEDVGYAELNDRYLIPRGNRGRKEDELCGIERYVLARAV